MYIYMGDKPQNKTEDFFFCLSLSGNHRKYFRVYQIWQWQFKLLSFFFENLKKIEMLPWVCVLFWTSHEEDSRFPAQLFNYISNFWRFWYHNKAHIFIINHVFCLENIGENAPRYSNYNSTHTVRKVRTARKVGKMYKIALNIQMVWPFQPNF